jgi:hypothetical protein
VKFIDVENRKALLWFGVILSLATLSSAGYIFSPAHHPDGFEATLEIEGRIMITGVISLLTAVYLYVSSKVIRSFKWLSAGASVVAVCSLVLFMIGSLAV